jgi:hypothetical protein
VKYKIVFLVLIVIVISINFYDSYASGPLSFDQKRIVLDHSSVISCVGCTDVGSTIDVVLNGTSGSKTITLYKINDTTNYSSSFVKFTTCSSCGPLDFNTAAGQTITVSSLGYTSDAADIFGTGTLSNDSTQYGKTKKSITPNSSGVCGLYGNDRDGDLICDQWENNSEYPAPCPRDGPGLCIRTSASMTPYFLGCDPTKIDFRNICPSVDKADTYFEIDWMLGHKPGDDVISAVADSFTNSNYVAKNGVSGITFHAQLDEELPHVNTIPWNGSTSTPGFDQLKYWWFGTAAERSYTFPNENLASNWITSQRSQKGQVFHYTIFTHSQYGQTSSSGISEMPGNDAMVSLGAFDGKVGSKDQQKGTLLHEIGHNLYLDHGGNTAINCKPNYLSVMSYSRQFSDFISDRPLDYSRSLLATLKENNLLDENVGVATSTPSGLKTVYGPSSVLVTNTGGYPIDWNRDKDSTDMTANADINNFGITGCATSPNQVLNGFLDWDKTRIKLSSLGVAGSGGEDGSIARFDPNSVVDDGMNYETVVVNELSSEDVANMRILRVDSLLSTLDNIPDDDFIGNVADVRKSYTDEINEIKMDIMKNYRGENTMVDAYAKMLAFQSKFDDDDANNIISSEKVRQKLYMDIQDVIMSQSKAIPEFSTFSILILAVVFVMMVFFSKKQSIIGAKLRLSK